MGLKVLAVPGPAFEPETKSGSFLPQTVGVFDATTFIEILDSTYNFRHLR